MFVWTEVKRMLYFEGQNPHFEAYYISESTEANGNFATEFSGTKISS